MASKIHDLVHEVSHGSEKALSELTDAAVNGHRESPTQHIHGDAETPETDSWIKKYLPHHVDLQELESGHHLGNYVIDRETGEKSWETMSVYVRLGMHLLFYGSKQAEFLHWKRTEKYLETESRKMGEAYDRPESVDHILPFIKSFSLEDTLAQLVEPDPSKYPNFNAFFSRAIREDARPIAEPENAKVVSSVADCRLSVFPTVDLATQYWIKGSGFTIERLLGSAEKAKLFEGGSVAIHRLAPQDYHRWHAPVDGTVRSVEEIPGAYYTVNPQAINQNGTLDVFCENRRSVMMVEQAGTGRPVAIVAIGAMLVGSVIYVDGLEQPGAQMRRGQCVGKFQYGGSTVVTLHPRDDVALDQDLVRNSIEQNCETLVKVGWRIGAYQ
ncbi:Phosphatidylserine decarboxylase proenzyme 2 [Apiospora arundinis]|uniref:Phosphatidylserine decarboxylase proenzyme 2 n=1 Tax=Apiospora arundinis TaxID=335852 RepID=A0ABR2HP69_9PEZI